MSNSTITHESGAVRVVTGDQVTVFRGTPEDAAHQVALLHAKVESLQSALTEANRRLAEARDVLCSRGYELLGWGTGRSLEPLDSWFADNEGGPVEATEAAGEGAGDDN